MYQIYPRSFQDTTGNGIGDLNGITERMGYLADTLGVDAIWISPFYPSPMADFGYDVSDYTDVNPMFGTLDDFDRLLDTAHDRGLKVIVDWVPNHTSDQHPWFVESRSSRTQPETRMVRVARFEPGGGLPNNWQSRVRWSGMDPRRRHRPVVSPLLPRRTTGSQLAQPSGRCCDV